jgi:tetratricopeptide (TPR) repeat protein
VDQALVDGLIDVRDYARYLVGVQPVVDNLFDPEENIRKNATFALKERRDRSAVEMLERSLDDPSEEVRLFAAEALENMDSTYNRAIYRLVLKIRESPTPRLHFVLGRVYYDFAENGSNDPGISRIYYEKSVKELTLARKLGEDPVKILIYEGAARAKLGQLKEAIEIYEDLRKDQSKDLVVLLRLAGFYFARREFEKVGELARQIVELDKEGRYGRVMAPWCEQ